ncbi:hypothetical protein J6590_052324 [Homalodisca vitripennis]|nr:hypothetical protein J6590_052324 [Homalodisca vitripennis]
MTQRYRRKKSTSLRRMVVENGSEAAAEERTILDLMGHCVDLVISPLTAVHPITEYSSLPPNNSSSICTAFWVNLLLFDAR